MDWTGVNGWEVILDLVVFGFCSATLWVSIRQRKKIKPGTGPVAVDQYRDPIDPRLRQLLASHSEKSFARMLHALGSQGYLSEKVPGGDASRTVHAAGAAPGGDDGRPLPIRRPRPGAGAHRRVLELSRAGLSVGQIAARLRIPRAEIELVLKLGRGAPTATRKTKDRVFDTGFHPARTGC